MEVVFVTFIRDTMLLWECLGEDIMEFVGSMGFLEVGVEFGRELVREDGNLLMRVD